MSRDSKLSDRISIFWTKLKHWEFWPFGVVYFPIAFYWIWLSFRARSFFFFSSSNPGIEFGGMLGESKFKIHTSLPEEYTPKTILLDKNCPLTKVRALMEQNGLAYPVILKPDIGERGWMVAKITDDHSLKEYLQINPVDFLLQEYIDLPLELGVFYYRHPNRNQGKVTSVVRKKMLEVTGNGVDTVRDLMKANPRARLQIRTFEKDYPELLDKIPDDKQTLELMPIGNHCRGTTFLNAESLINDSLHKRFDELSRRIEGFYFGRFDIRCRNEKELVAGDFKIMELNGAGAEPGHIYDPAFSLFAAYKSILSHLKALYEISLENKNRGIPYMTFSEGIEFIRKIRSYNKLKTVSWEEKA